MNPRSFPRRAVLFSILFIAFPAIYGQSISGVINSYYKVSAVNPVPNALTVTSAAGLTPGMKVLIIQMKGASINTSNTASFGNITSINNAGNYQFNTVCAVAGNDILLKYELLRTYDVSGLVQLIPVPQYNSVTVTDTVKPAAWSAAAGTGGVVVLEARDTVFLNSAIDASGKGFVGGALLNNNNCVWNTNVIEYTLAAVPADPNINSSKKGEGIAEFLTNGEYGRGKQANGGGGGNNHNTGGAGGSNFGSGGNGGLRSNETFFQCHGGSPGVGGLPLSSSGYSPGNNRIYMGGGGGAGHENNFVATPGGNGGGIIIILANTIYNSGGRLMANGGSPFNPACANPLNAEGDGGGGGGAGGSIILDVQRIANGSLTAEVNGANGSGSGYATNACTGPGGGGGGGVVWASGVTTMANINALVSGGDNGIISPTNSSNVCNGSANGATAGANGDIIPAYVPPVANSFICMPLPANEINYFEGTSALGGNTFKWHLAETGNIGLVQLERTQNQVNYQTITVINTPERFNRGGLDSDVPEGTTYYRLKITRKNGSVTYSKVVALQKINEGFHWSVMYPNPANNSVKISFSCPKTGEGAVLLNNQWGQLITRQSVATQKGHNSIVLPLNGLPAGVYFITLEVDGIRKVKKLVVNTIVR